jgi:hypothetical protein
VGHLPRQDGDVTADQISRERGHLIVVALRPTIFNGHIFAFHIAGIIQGLAKRGDKRGPQRLRSGAEKPDYGDGGFLRPSSNRCDCEATANAADERSPIHH